MTPIGQVLPAMSHVEYSRIEAVNWSALRQMRVSPKHFQAALATPPKDADHFRLGRATHTAVLEPDRFPLEYVIWVGGQRRGGKWEDFSALHEGRTILTEEQYATACAIRDAVRAHPIAASYLTKGQAEVSLLWNDPATGRACKARPDWVGGEIADLKTAKTIDQFLFASAVAKLAYHCQLAWYRAGWLACTGEELPCALIAVENEQPHDVAAYRMSEDALYAGGKEIRELLTRLADCEATGQFPGRYTREVDLHLPAWATPEAGRGGEDAG